MHSSFYFMLCIGLVVTSIIALTNTPRWPARLMLAGSICSLILTGLLTLMFNQISYGLITFILIVFALNILGFLLFTIGLFAYALKTNTASKANQQLEYLNFQLKDQLEIQQKQQEK